MDGPDLSPATRRRPPAPETPPAAPAAPIAVDELSARLAALESATRAVDARLEALERSQRVSVERLQAAVTDGFQEVASRALVLAEATDEVLTRHGEALDRIEAALARDDVERLRAAVDAVGATTESSIATLASTIESAAPGRDETARRVADLTVAMARLQATVEGVVANPELADVRARVELVAERLGTLLGGPTLTELMDRIDELGDRAPEAPKRRRLRAGE